MLALIAAVVSYSHMYKLALRHGEPEWRAALFPLSVDGMIVGASMALLSDARHTGAVGLPASDRGGCGRAQTPALMRCHSGLQPVPGSGFSVDSMNKKPLVRGVEQHWAPQSCTLPTAGRPLRLAEFDDLFTSSARRVEQHGTTAHIHLNGGTGLTARVRDLTERESSCCSFFTFALEGTDEDLLLSVTVPPEQQEVLDALAARAKEKVT